MVTNQRIPGDAGINQEGSGSAMTGESVPGADGQNAVPLISIVLTLSYQIIQNTVPDTPMQSRFLSNKGSFAVSGRNSS